MRHVVLIGDGPKASVLGFGCSAIMGRVGRRQSLRALAAAYAAGVNFFDTARSYGYGESETVVGEFLRGRRDRTVLSTKFGIVPVHQAPWKRALMPVVRTIVDNIPSARSIVRTQVKGQLRENQITRAVLKNSLDESLRKLRTDYVDILFVHSAPISVLSQIDLLEDLDRLVTAGKIRMAGISSERDVVTAALQSGQTILRAMQFPASLGDSSFMCKIAEAQPRRLVFVANHPFGGVEGMTRLRSRLSELAESPATPTEIRTRLKVQDEQIVPEIILNLILADTGIQVVIPSMMKLSHLRANLDAVSSCRFTPGELEWIKCNLSPTRAPLA
jgi:aryl-alcohol dehydrogenase-like predicted oxidoreductase